MKKIPFEMNTSKNNRQHLRRFFTKSIEKLDRTLKLKDTCKENLLSLLRQLDDKSSRLFDADREIKELSSFETVNDEKLEMEYNEVEYFKDVLIKYRFICESRLNQIKKDQEDRLSGSIVSITEKFQRNSNFLN